MAEEATTKGTMRGCLFMASGERTSQSRAQGKQIPKKAVKREHVYEGSTKKKAPAPKHAPAPSRIMYTIARKMHSFSRNS